MNIAFDSPKLDAVLDALANQKRRAIVHDLSFQPSTITRLARKNDLSLPAIHKHIRTLEQAQLIVRRKVGRTNFVALDASALSLAQDWIMQYHTKWGSVDATLANYITRMQE